MYKLLAFATSLVLSQTSFAGKWVNWESNGYLASIFIDAKLLKTGSETIVDPEWDYSRSACSAKVYRPDLQEGDVVKIENVVKCTLVKASGETVEGQASLSKVPVRAWGNKFDKLPFQVKNHDFAKVIFDSCKNVYQTNADTYPLTYMQVASPGGGTLVTSYSLDVSKDKNSTSYFNVNANWDLNAQGTYDLYSIAVVFIFP